MRGRIPFWLHLMSNAYWEALDFELPSVPETAVSGWQRWIDTARESPEDIMDPAAAPPVPGTRYRVMPRSVVALFVRIDARSGPALEIEGQSIVTSSTEHAACSTPRGMFATVDLDQGKRLLRR